MLRVFGVCVTTCAAAVEFHPCRKVNYVCCVVFSIMSRVKLQMFLYGLQFLLMGPTESYLYQNKQKFNDCKREYDGPNEEESAGDRVAELK